MKKTTITPHPGQEEYPDLETPIEEHFITDDVVQRITAVVSDGQVTFTDTFDGHNVTISEWDFSQFVEKWVSARLEQKFPTTLNGFSVGDEIVITHDVAGMKKGEVGTIVELLNHYGLVTISMRDYKGQYNMLPGDLEPHEQA